MTKQSTRRELLVGSAAIAGTALVGDWVLAKSPAPVKAKVVIVTTRESISIDRPAPQALIDKMLEIGITNLACKSDPEQAWSTFIRPTDTVCLPTAGGQMENIPEVNIAVYKALQRLGVNKMTIGTHRWSPAWKEKVTTALAGNLPEMITNGLFGIANKQMDALVITPTIKHHDIAGISGTLKLYACFSKLGPWNYHGENPVHSAHWDGVSGGGMGACGWVPANDFKEQRKLHIVDMIRVGVSSRGFTVFKDGWVFTKSLVISTDAVAADRVAFDLYLKVGEASGRIDPLNHVLRADTEYHAGISDLKQIEIKRITV
jgi:hypothetical protein